MQYRDVELRGIPVVTKSGQKLGKLVAYVIDTEHHVVAQYVVSRASILAKILPDELLVGNSQVISLDNELMVVHDAVFKEREAARARPRNAEAASHGTANSVRES